MEKRAPVAAPADDLLLINASIVDPESRKVRKGNLLIRGGVVIAAPAGAVKGFTGQVIDLKGKWIIPGLNDLHTHSFGNQPAWGPAGDAPGTPGIAVRLLAVGVTGFLDLFGDENGLFQIRAQQHAGELGGADVFASLSCLTAPKGHCSEYGVPTRTMSTPVEARAVVADLALRKPDVIKIVYQPSGTLPSIDKPTFAAAVDEARKHGLKTIVHIGTWEEVSDAIEVGATAVTHIPDPAIPAGMAARMAKSGIAFIPTLAVETDFEDFVYDPAVLDNPMARAVTTPAVIAAYRAKDFIAGADKNRAANEAIQRVALTNVKAAADAGVTILLGTDAGNWGTLQGYSVHRELMIMVEAGLSPWQALAASTNLAGDFLGRSFGVNPGDEANLVILDASPIADIRNTQAIAMVIHHGRIVDRQALLASPIAGLVAR
ncbi:MAG: amidohydrolase family protein [Sphingomonas sp.]